MKKRIFSGAQPTGELHIGNYLGALKNWVALQDEYESFYCIVNLHALTLPQDPQRLAAKDTRSCPHLPCRRRRPAKVIRFYPVGRPEPTLNLTWVLSCISRMGELERMTQFKDKAKKETLSLRSELMTGPDLLIRAIAELIGFNCFRRHRVHGRWDLAEADRVQFWELEQSDMLYTRVIERAGVGLFTYPVLMAADILLYQTDLVPIGKDQKQHLELTRDLAERFNRDFGETFKVPEPYIPPVGANILSLQDPAKKMSKSDENPNGSIFLLDDADTITKKIKKAVTDSGTEINFDPTRPAITNLLTIYQLLTGKISGRVRLSFRRQRLWPLQNRAC